MLGSHLRQLRTQQNEQFKNHISTFYSGFFIYIFQIVIKSDIVILEYCKSHLCPGYELKSTKNPKLLASCQRSPAEGDGGDKGTAGDHSQGLVERTLGIKTVCISAILYALDGMDLLNIVFFNIIHSTKIQNT